jgi:hypothetical protein
MEVPRRERTLFLGLEVRKVIWDQISIRKYVVDRRTVLHRSTPNRFSEVIDGKKPAERRAKTIPTRKSDSIPSQNPLAQHSLLMHEGNSPADNTITTNPQIKALIKAESMTAMCDIWDVETVQYGGFA